MTEAYRVSPICISHIPKNVLLDLHMTSSLDKLKFKMIRPDRIGTFVFSFSLIFAAVPSGITVKTTLLFLCQILDSCDITISTYGQKSTFVLKKHTLFNVSLIKIQLTA